MKLGEIRKANPARQLVISYLQDVVCLIEETLTESIVQKIYDHYNNLSIDLIEFNYMDDEEEGAFINVLDDYPNHKDHFSGIDEIFSIDYKMLKEKYVNENTSIMASLNNINFNLKEKLIEMTGNGWYAEPPYGVEDLFVGKDRIVIINNEEWEVKIQIRK